MPGKEKVRVDKWLWCMRVYKTRTLAAEACARGRVLMGDAVLKASREIKPGDVLLVRKLPVVYTLRVLALTENRLPAARINEFMEDITSPEELDKLRISEQSFFKRDRGSGRPTKKERRLLDEVMDGNE